MAIAAGRRRQGAKVVWLLGVLGLTACGGAGSSDSGGPASPGMDALEWSEPQPIEQPDVSRLAPPVQAQGRVKIPLRHRWCWATPTESSA